MLLGQRGVPLRFCCASAGCITRVDPSRVTPGERGQGPAAEQTRHMTQKICALCFRFPYFGRAAFCGMFSVLSARCCSQIGRAFELGLCDGSGWRAARRSETSEPALTHFPGDEWSLLGQMVCSQTGEPLGWR